MVHGSCEESGRQTRAGARRKRAAPRSGTRGVHKQMSGFWPSLCHARSVVGRARVFNAADSPEQRNAVRRELLIAGIDRKSFGLCLGDDQTIEWIAVVAREVNQRLKMFEVHLKDAETVGYDRARKKVRVRDEQLYLAKPRFDRDLPCGRMTYEFFVVRRLDRYEQVRSRRCYLRRTKGMRGCRATASLHVILDILQCPTALVKSVIQLGWEEGALGAAVRVDLSGVRTTTCAASHEVPQRSTIIRKPCQAKRLEKCVFSCSHIFVCPGNCLDIAPKSDDLQSCLIAC